MSSALLMPVTATGTRPIRVLVVDDSTSTRLLLVRALNSDPAITVVGSAGDAYAARDLIVTLRPDVMTLDVSMPQMDGVTFLRRVMKYQPMPVIIVSGLAREGAEIVVDALAAGALDVIQKPADSIAVTEFTSDLISRVKAAAQSEGMRNGALIPSAVSKARCRLIAPRDILFALGASTGGVQALTEVLRAFPADAPPTLVAQHLPAHFTTSFAKRLDSLCEIEVREASDRDRAVPGLALVAPGGAHMTLHQDSGGYFVQVRAGPPIRHQRPSVDLLFESVAEVARGNGVGVILSGMGNDGALGLLKMRQVGACTIAQDEASSIVFGMAQAAIKLGAVEQVVSLSEVAAALFAAHDHHKQMIGQT